MRNAIAGCLVLALGILTTEAAAHGSLGLARESDLAAMAEAANLVVVADIASVEYRNTPIKGEQNTIPAGLVTLKISKVLRGKAPQGPLVLRFLGGPDGTGGIAGFSGVPLFAPNETNVLFIKANGDMACPLVNCEWGRFRVLNGAVYNTHGSPVYSVKKGHVVAYGRPPKELSTFRFPTPTFDAVMQHAFVKEQLAKSGMTYGQAKARYEKEAPKFIEYSVVHSPEQETAEPVDDPIPPGVKGAGAATILKGAKSLAARTSAKPMTLQSFVSALTPIAARAKRPVTPVSSASAAADFALPAIGKTPPPALKATVEAPLDPEAEAEAADPLQKRVPNAPKN